MNRMLEQAKTSAAARPAVGVRSKTASLFVIVLVLLLSAQATLAAGTRGEGDTAADSAAVAQTETVAVASSEISSSNNAIGKYCQSDDIENAQLTHESIKF